MTRKILNSIFLFSIYALLHSCQTTNKENDGKTETISSIDSTNTVAKITVNTDDIINNIRKEFSNINSNTNLKIQNFHWENNYTPNCGLFTGTLKKFSDAADKVKKVSLLYGTDHSEINDEYYYVDGKLIFVYEKNSFYPPMENVSPQMNESRIYLHDDEVIKTLYNGTGLDSLQQESVNLLVKFGRKFYTAKSIPEFDKIMCED